MTKEEIEKKIIDKYGTDEFELLNFSVSKAPVSFKCLRCGKINNLKRLDSLFSSDKKNLCSCMRVRQLSKAGELLKKEFNNWYETKGCQNYELIQGFTTMKGKIVLKCLKCNAEQKRDTRLLLKDDRCLCCEKKAGFTKTNEQIDKELKDKFGMEYIRVGDYKNSNTPILFKHSCGKIFSMSPHQLMTDKGRCPCLRKESKGELKLKDILLKYNINYIEQYRIEDLKKAPFDFYLPDYNILIEYQGIQHFQPRDLFGGEEQLKIQQEIDSRKSSFAKNNGYKLIYFSYEEYKDLENLLVQRLAENGVSSSELKKQTSD